MKTIDNIILYALTAIFLVCVGGAAGQALAETPYDGPCLLRTDTAKEYAECRLMEAVTAAVGCENHKSIDIKATFPRRRYPRED